jgi:hypothetical protein
MIMMKKMNEMINEVMIVQVKWTVVVVLMFEKSVVKVEK